jgi:hypothetical protein
MQPTIIQRRERARLRYRPFQSEERAVDCANLHQPIDPRTARPDPAQQCAARMRRNARRAGRGVAMLAACLALIALTPSASAQRLHKYLVSVDQDLAALRVHACFSGHVPQRLVAESLDASLALERASRAGTTKRLEPNGTELRLGAAPDDSCIDYRVNLIEFTGRHQHGGNPTRRVGSDLITDLGLWFWRPEALAEDEDIEVTFALPTGIAVSAPWQRAGDTGSSLTYRVGHSAYEWPGAFAFGHFTERIVAVPGGRLLVAVLDGRPKVDEQQILDWLQGAANAVASLYGRFPVASLQVVVVPGARSPSPVPSAYVLRGGGPAAHFFINQRRPIEEFRSDWSAVHELSHLLLPYINSEDAWLSEGVASYYQNVLLARSGTITAQEAWQSMHSAFERARRDETGVTLSAATERMYRNGNFMRVYWEGAAIMLLADQQLRSRSGGRQSLDTVFEQFQRCCLSADVGWHAGDLLHRLDQLAGGSVFAKLFEEQVSSDVFPDLTELYRLFGLQSGADGKLSLSDSAPLRADRDAIMLPPASEPDARSH